MSSQELLTRGPGRIARQPFPPHDAAAETSNNGKSLRENSGERTNSIASTQCPPKRLTPPHGARSTVGNSPPFGAGFQLPPPIPLAPTPATATRHRGDTDLLRSVRGRPPSNPMRRLDQALSHS